MRFGTIQGLFRITGTSLKTCLRGSAVPAAGVRFAAAVVEKRHILSQAKPLNLLFAFTIWNQRALFNRRII